MPVKHCSPSQLHGKLEETWDLPSVPGKPAKSIPGNGMVEVAAFHELSDQHGLLPLQAATTTKIRTVKPVAATKVQSNFAFMMYSMGATCSKGCRTE